MARARLRMMMTEAPERLECEVCGGRLDPYRCKLLCPNCGFARDCTDP